MRPHTTLAAAALAAGLLLTGCSPDNTPPPTTSSAPTSGSASPTTSASPTPTSTLTAAQQEAFEQATDVALAYRQTITDLYSGARTQINDLDNYATGDLLDRGRTEISLGVRKGIRSEPKGAQLELVSAEPVTVKLKSDPPTVVLWACIDFTAVTDIHADGSQHPGGREELQYTVVKTSHLPDPGWAVAAVKGAESPEERAC